MRVVFLVVFTFWVSGCASLGRMDPDVLLGELETAEQAWLDAAAHHDRRAMSRILSPEFRITMPGGAVETRDDVIGDLDQRPLKTSEEPRPYTEKRSIRILDNTAIVSGVYVQPAPDGSTPRRFRYTDTWMRTEGRWRLVASHRS